MIVVMKVEFFMEYVPPPDKKGKKNCFVCWMFEDQEIFLSGRHISLYFTLTPFRFLRWSLIGENYYLSRHLAPEAFKSTISQKTEE